MKPLIVGVAMTILFSFFLVYQQDNNLYIRELENLKYVADEVAASGALYYEAEEYSDGKMVYRKSESVKAIDNMIKSLLNLDSSLNPTGNNYWTNQINYSIHILDDSKIKSTYKNKTFIGDEAFSYNFLFNDPEADYTKLISEPSIIVTINAGKPRFRLSFLNPNNSIRSSGYEYLSR